MKTAETPAPLPCDLCRSTDAEELSLVDRDGAYLRTVVCRRCGLVYSDPRPDSSKVREYYERDYRMDYKATYQPRPKHVYRAGKVAVDRFRGLEGILTPGCRVLDFGAGGGEVVFVLRALGYDASGFEPNEGYARFASETLGLPVSPGFYQDAKVEAESQDVVTAFHVVEHLESPYDALIHARRWLRPGGRLLVEVPNVEAVCQWPRSRFHRAHLYNFSPATLETLGKRAGYEVLKSTVSPDGGNIAVVLRKAGEVGAVSGEIPGNYERVSSIVRGHTALSHLLSPYPYARPFRKLAARIRERAGIRKDATARETLESLCATELRR